MARGAEAKLRRRNRRKNDDAINMFGEETTGSDEMPIPNGFPTSKKTDDEFEALNGQGEDEAPLPKQKKKKKAVISGERAANLPPGAGGSSTKGIKATPLILLFLMVGTAVLPVLIYAGDFMSTYLRKTDFTGSIGYTLGIGTVPRKRTIAFYEKHAPEKLNDVPKILSKHYGEYPTLIKKLERKYQDYGYFLGWEEDEAVLTLFKERAKEWYNNVWLKQYWNRYAPQQLKTGFRNIRYNLTFLYKKGRRLYRKHLWPLLEPIFGVPKGGEAQKRKDAAEARKRREQQGGMASGRRRNKDYRDDVED